MEDFPPFEDFGYVYYVYLASLRGAPAAYSAAELRAGPAPRRRSAAPRDQDGGVGRTAHRVADFRLPGRAWAQGREGRRASDPACGAPSPRGRPARMAVARRLRRPHGLIRNTTKAAENLSAGLDSIDQVIA